MNPNDKYYPPEWRDPKDRETLGYILSLTCRDKPDLYHHSKYGEHVNEWDVVL